mgnify:CR=1 FL=1
MTAIAVGNGTAGRETEAWVRGLALPDNCAVVMVSAPDGVEVQTVRVWERADELGLPRAKAVTTVKPSGTLSKIMDTTEGVHRPLGRYIFNNVTFSKHDPIVPKMKAAPMSR